MFLFLLGYFCLMPFFTQAENFHGKDQLHLEIANTSTMSLNGLRGVNLQPSYYANGNPNFGWSLMEQYSSTIKLVRIEIEPTMDHTSSQSWVYDDNNLP